MPQAAMDRLMRMCEEHSADIAEIWYKALSENERTAAFSAQPKVAPQACWSPGQSIGWRHEYG